jgi:hypothetical protein
MKKLLMVMVMIVCAEKLLAPFDFDDISFPMGGSVDSQELSSTSIEGDADRLLNILYNDEQRGEKVSDLNEWRNPLFGWTWSNNPATQKDLGGNLLYQPLSKDHINALRKKQIQAVMQQYSDDQGIYSTDDEGLATLGADIKALEKKANAAQNKELKAKLQELLKFGKLIQNIMQQQLMKVNVNQKLETLKLQATGSSLAESLMQADMELVRAKKSNDRSLILICEEVKKRLQAIDAEIKILKKQSNNVVKDAFDKAKKTLEQNEINLSKVIASQKPRYQITIDLYKEVMAQLAIEISEEDRLQQEAEQIMAMVDHQIQIAGNAAQALESAQQRLQYLQNDPLVRSGRLPKTKQDEIDKQKKVVQELMGKAQEADTIENRMNSRVDQLLAQYDGDIAQALRESKLVAGRTRTKFDIDVKSKLEKLAEENAKKEKTEQEYIDQVEAFVKSKISK